MAMVSAFTIDGIQMLTCRAGGEDTLHPERYNIVYNYCMDCGDFRAREERACWCIAPIAHKQGATLVTKPKDLKGLNKYSS